MIFVIAKRRENNSFMTLFVGTDPKSVLCAFFKAGQCTKGDKCKFSHDLSIGRKAEKRSMYDDQREGENGESNHLYHAFTLYVFIHKFHLLTAVEPLLLALLL